MKTNPNPRFVFFGTPELAVTVLEELRVAGFIPTLVVTQPDKPAGRGRTLTPPPVSTWATEHTIPVLQPKKLDEEFMQTIKNEQPELFIVAAYGKILPQTLLDIPPKGTLNVHPSLLPRLRGPSPIRSAILLDEKKIGVSIMLLDAQMDHGPIVAQREIPFPDNDPVLSWPPKASVLENILAHEGGILLAEVLPQWVLGEITPTEQAHDAATFCRMLKKEDGLVDLIHGDPYQNLLKIRGCEGWPSAYTFFERNGQTIRVQILDAHLEDEVLVLDTIKPEGKNAMPYLDFARSGAVPIPSSQAT